MITQFKIYESKILNFTPEKNDFVLLSGDGWNIFKSYVKVISDSAKYNNEIHYQVSGILNNKITKFWVSIIEMERFLTPEEIDEFIMKIEIDKYNL